MAGIYEWYLGLVNYVHEDLNISVSHFVQESRSNKLIWTIPDESDIQIIEPEQIIKFKVQYMQSQRIRCTLNKDIALDIKKELKNHLGK